MPLPDSLRAKAAFWAAVIGSLVFLSIPSWVLVEASARYLAFLRGSDAPVIKPAAVRSLFRHGTERDGDVAVEFVSFRIKAAGAKAVGLSGDFSRWSASGLVMTKGKGDVWEIAVPLPSGRYRYRYLVDGAPVLDPDKPAVDVPGRGRASLLVLP